MRRASMSVASVAISSAVLCACGSEPIAVASHATPDAPAAVFAAKAADAPSPTIAIDDALSRLLPALDASTAASLKAPLIAIGTALKSGDAAALRAAITVARQALARAATVNGALAPDLDAVGLSLDAAASAD